MESYIIEFSYCDPFMIVRKLPREKNFVFFDSATQGLSGNSKYSFIAYDPFSVIRFSNGYLTVDGDESKRTPLAVVADYLNMFENDTAFLPFSNGLAGFISYEFASYLEPKIKHCQQTDSGLPQLLLGTFDLVVAFDHEAQKAWIVSSGLPEKQSVQRKNRAKKRGEMMKDIIDNGVAVDVTMLHYIQPSSITPNNSYQEFCNGIEKTLNYIRAGDIYLANIAQCFTCDLPVDYDTLALYNKLRNYNPAPFSAYIKFEDMIIASASPERFISVRFSEVITSPIKGTSPRHSSPIADRKIALSLYHCEKNRAENLMIVDLMRNDLSRVCNLFSVKVPKLFSIETFATVHHLVSTIKGNLKPEYTLCDLITATFPGGSITGAPKKRALEIINEIEKVERGPYCGIIGYFGSDKTMDSSIVIRTFVIKENQLSFHVGSGIVADSSPHDEYVETLIKAKALWEVLTGEEMQFSSFIQ